MNQVIAYIGEWFTDPRIVNTIGLGFDIIGALLLVWTVIGKTPDKLEKDKFARFMTSIFTMGHFEHESVESLHRTEIKVGRLGPF